MIQVFDRFTEDNEYEIRSNDFLQQAQGDLPLPLTKRSVALLSARVEPALATPSGE